MESCPIFASDMPATAPPSPQTGEMETAVELLSLPSLPDVGTVMFSSEMDHMGIWGSPTAVPFPLPTSIDPSPPWWGGSSTVLSARSPWTAVPRFPTHWQGGGEGTSAMESSRPDHNHFKTMRDSPSDRARRCRWLTTDVSSFKAVVQSLTGMCSRSLPPRSSIIPDIVSDKTTDSDITSEITHDHRGCTVAALSTLHKREIIGRVIDMKDEIIGRVDDKHEEIIGRAADKHKIMELILSHDPNINRLTIVCITGADGLGKTTLASVVYCDDTMCRSFEARAWLSLSEVYNYEELLRSFMASLTGVSCGIIEQVELEEELKEELTGKKFLLVLDNLWENNVAVCRHLLLLLSMGDKESAVMVTTSSDMVAVQLGTAYAYKLKPFMHDSFLILAKPNNVEYPPLESIIRKTPPWYSGFPIFAKAIRSILCSAFSEKWLDATLERKLKDILSKSDNHLHHLLYLSYRYLRPNQKRCFLYCSMFPRDYTYRKEKMLRLWMSQGFLKSEKEKHGHNHKENFEDAFDELLHKSFFDYFPSSDVKEKKYVMHELSSLLASSVSGEKFFRAYDHELHCIPKDVNHLSVIPKQRGSEIYFNYFTEFRELSTFLLVCNSRLESTDNQFHVMDLKSLDVIFRNLRCLKTLDLSHTDIKELPESIGYMSALCFLGLNNTNIRRLPNTVCNLFNLQTMELQNSAYLVELPSEIKNLSSLYHLDASKEHGAIYVPPGMGQLTSLRTLTTFTVGGVSWNCKISELANLNNLEGYLHIHSLNNVENAEDAWRACLAAKKLKKLSLEWCHAEDAESNDRIYVAEKVLNALKPHYLLEELNIKGYYGPLYASWIADCALSELASITLDNCYNCEKLPTLGGLPLLRSLFVQNLRGVRVISYEFCATGTISRKSFPKLEILKLRDMYNLEYWIHVSDGDFPSLRSLSIERCPKLNSIPCFQSLSDLSIFFCGKLNLPCLQSLQTLKIGSLKQRKCLALSELRSLQMLEVTCCDHLCSVDGLIRLQSLKQLMFRTCPKLNFFQDEPLPDTLETFDIHHNCYALRNWQPIGFEELSDASKVRRKFIRRKFVRELFYLHLHRTTV